MIKHVKQRPKHLSYCFKGFIPMKRLFAVSMALLFAFSVFRFGVPTVAASQPVTTKSIGAAGDYATLQAAFDDTALTGEVVLSILNDLTDTGVVEAPAGRITALTIQSADGLNKAMPGITVLALNSIPTTLRHLGTDKAKGTVTGGSYSAGAFESFDRSVELQVENCKFKYLYGSGYNTGVTGSVVLRLSGSESEIASVVPAPLMLNNGTLDAGSLTVEIDGGTYSSVTAHGSTLAALGTVVENRSYQTSQVSIKAKNASIANVAGGAWISSIFAADRLSGSTFTTNGDTVLSFTGCTLGRVVGGTASWASSGLPPIQGQLVHKQKNVDIELKESTVTNLLWLADYNVYNDPKCTFQKGDVKLSMDDSTVPEVNLGQNVSPASIGSVSVELKNGSTITKLLDGGSTSLGTGHASTLTLQNAPQSFDTFGNFVAIRFIGAATPITVKDNLIPAKNETAVSIEQNVWGRNDILIDFQNTAGTTVEAGWFTANWSSAWNEKLSYTITPNPQWYIEKSIPTITGWHIVNGPAKMEYTLGEELLDFTGLTVALTLDDGTETTVPFAAFDSYGLSAYVSGDTAQRNGAPIAARDDGMPITIIKTGAAAGTAETAETIAVYAIVTARAGAGGSIVPSGATRVALGSQLSLTITPDTGYEIHQILINGRELPLDTVDLSGDIITVTVMDTLDYQVNFRALSPQAGGADAPTTGDQNSVLGLRALTLAAGAVLIFTGKKRGDRH